MARFNHIYSVKQSHQRYYISIAHLVIGEDYSEAIHGHNLGIDINIFAPLNERKMVIDFLDLAPIIINVLETWDHFTLIPGKNPVITIIENGSSIQLDFHDKKYILPKTDIKILPVENITVESMTRLLLEDIYEHLERYQLNKVSVTIYEYPWQSATCERTFN